MQVPLPKVYSQKTTESLKHIQFIRQKFSPPNKMTTQQKRQRKNFISQSPVMKYRPRRQKMQNSFFKNQTEKRQNLKLSQRLVLPKSFQYKVAQDQLQIRKSTDVKSSNEIYTPKSPKSSTQNDRLSFLKKKSSALKIVEVDDFIFLQFLGMGRMGEYFTALHKPSHFLVALKRINKKVLVEKNCVDRLIKTIKRQYSMDHPNIRKLFGLFDDEKYCYLVLQFMEGRVLDKHFKNLGKLQQLEVGQKLHEICSALKYIHNRNLIHRSLKQQCVFLSYGICKICDFELISYPTQIVMQINTVVQEKDLQKKFQWRKNCFAYDLKCLGLMIYQLITGKSIPQQQDYKRHLRQFKNINFKKIDYSGCSQQAKELIKLLLQTKLFETMSIDQIFNTNFVMKYKDDVQWVPRQFMPKKSDSPKQNLSIAKLMKRNSLNISS